MSQDGLYDYLAHQDCLPQPEPDDLDEALKLVYDAKQRVIRGQELTRILVANLNPFKEQKP